MNIKATVQYTFTGTIEIVADSLEEARQLIKDDFEIDVKCVSLTAYNDGNFVGWNFDGGPSETNIVVEEDKSGKRYECSVEVSLKRNTQVGSTASAPRTGRKTISSGTLTG